MNGSRERVTVAVDSVQYPELARIVAQKPIHRGLQSWMPSSEYFVRRHFWLKQYSPPRPSRVCRPVINNRDPSRFVAIRGNQWFRMVPTVRLLNSVPIYKRRPLESTR